MGRKPLYLLAEIRVQVSQELYYFQYILILQ